MSLARLSAVTILVLLAIEGGAKEGGASCTVLELVEGNPRYNSLVCEAVEHEAAGRYERAALSLETALKLPLFEVPNFKLYGRLASVYAGAGDPEKARRVLEQGELALSVLAGIYRCAEGKGGYVLVDRRGEDVNSPFNALVASRMCGAALDYYYWRPSLEAFVRDAKLIGSFLALRKKVEEADVGHEGDQ